ncbi:MAG: hypothetical protein QOI31_1701 [Solirubrobacterales bacterium]|jgi:DNA-binding transcriptional ArsR family regulator|nr:hypothetical protein [Solirubrobacterales bacterium]
MMSTKTDRESAQQRMFRALGHPLRQRILVQLNKQVASPTQLADQLEVPINNVSYHVQILLKNDAIELVDTAQRRGAIEHFYRAIARPEISDEHWAQLPISVRRTLFDDTIQDIWDHLVEAAGEEGLDDEQSHVSWVPLDLDQLGYQDVVALLGETLERVMAIQAEVKERASTEGAAEAHRTEVAILHFHRAVVSTASD